MEHLGLLLSLAGGAYVVVAVLGLANFNPTTALGIMQSVGSVSPLLRGFVITALPLVIGFGAEAVMVSPRPQWWFAHHPRAFGAFLGLGIVMLGAIPWWMAGSSLMIVLPQVVRLLRNRGHPEPRASGRGRQVGVVAAATFFFAFLVAFVPWLPSQAITHAEAGVFTGYVLQSSEGHTTVLADRPRRLLRLDTARLSYETCTTPGDVLGRRAAWQLIPAFQASVEYPSCPATAPRLSPGPQTSQR